MSTRLKFILMPLVGAVLGMYFAAWPWERWPPVAGLHLVPEVLQRLLPPLGDALMVAALLAVMVDKAVKRELLEQFAREVSHHIIGYRLPAELRDYVMKYLTVDVIRTDWNITYTIELLETHPGFVKLTAQNAYVLQNNSLLEKKHSYSYYVERSWFPEIGESEILSFALTSPIAKESFDLRIGAGLETKTDSGFLQTSKVLALPPMPHGQYKCFAESVEYFPDCFFAQFVTLLPVLRASVTVYYPKDEMTFDLNLSCQDGKTTELQLSNGTQWTVDTPLLPGHSISTRWRKKATSTGTRPIVSDSNASAPRMPAAPE
jgi:hypothetical protein